MPRIGREQGGHGDQTTTVGGAQDARTAGYSLIVIGPDGTTVHALPGAGPVIIGRAAGSDVRIDDPSVSRRHARLVLGPTLRIEDLGSRNGVRVRGEAVPTETPTEIAPDEVIGVGNYSVVLQRRAPSARPLRLWSHDYFEVRVDDECARSERFGWSFALAHVRVQGERSAATTRAGFAAALRSIDAVGSWGPGEYQILLVEADAAEVDQILNQLRAAMSAQGVTVQCAVVSYPRDGRDAATLAARARAAALGQVEPSRDGAPPLIIDERMRSLHELATRIAGSDLNVLLLGETGTGKEILAEVIHNASPRAACPFLRLNCAALPEPLLESELFGHERGAFTGANQAKPGLVETAEGGTVFLDEVGELPAAIQAKFLRVLESREVRRVGGIKPRAVNVRFLAATNRDVEAEVARGRFRADLYYRLNGVSLLLPPLRERTAEIEPLARRFAAEAAERAGQPTPRFDPEALALLGTYDWPGNIRELRNTVERAVFLQTGGVVSTEHLPVDRMRATLHVPPSVAEPAASPQDPEAERIRAALERCAGSQTLAARELGISLRTLVNRLNRYGLPRPRKGRG